MCKFPISVLDFVRKISVIPNISTALRYSLFLETFFRATVGFPSQW